MLSSRHSVATEADDHCSRCHSHHQLHRSRDTCRCDLVHGVVADDGVVAVAAAAAADDVMMMMMLLLRTKSFVVGVVGVGVVDDDHYRCSHAGPVTFLFRPQ
jgi:hypothetical protein